jgi:hypothetical protein
MEVYVEPEAKLYTGGLILTTVYIYLFAHLPATTNHLRLLAELDVTLLYQQAISYRSSTSSHRTLELFCSSLTCIKTGSSAVIAFHDNSRWRRSSRIRLSNLKSHSSQVMLNSSTHTRRTNPAQERSDGAWSRAREVPSERTRRERKGSIDD